MLSAAGDGTRERITVEELERLRQLCQAQLQENEDTLMRRRVDFTVRCRQNLEQLAHSLGVSPMEELRTQEQLLLREQRRTMSALRRLPTWWLLHPRTRIAPLSVWLFAILVIGLWTWAVTLFAQAFLR